MPRYFLRHWRGELSIGHAFWIHLCAGGLVAIVCLKWLVPLVAGAHVVPLATLATVAVLSFALLFVWQVVGALRSWRRFSVRVSDTWGLYATIVCYAWVVVLALLDLSFFAMDPSLKLTPNWFRPRTHIEYDPTHRPQVVHISGRIEFGLSRELGTLLAAHPEIRTIEITSDGGVLTEARGVFLMARKSRLDTLASGRCYSACTLIFIAGEKRHLAPGAELGFHQYNIEAIFLPPGVDLEDEQNKDAQRFIDQGVSQRFINQAYAQSHDGMWVPTLDELLGSGVVTAAKASDPH